jgi:hypothetical protein
MNGYCMQCLTGISTPAALPGSIARLQGGPAAKNPQYLHCVEHALGLGDWAKQHGATLIATDDKDRSNSGESLFRSDNMTAPMIAYMFLMQE